MITIKSFFSPGNLFRLKKNSGKGPSYDNLKDAVLAQTGAANCVLVKYFINEWEWRKIPSLCTSNFLFFLRQ